MKKIFYIICTLFLMIPFVMGCRYVPKSARFTAEGIKLNTYVSIKLYGCGSDELAQKALDLCDYYEKIFSRTNEQSLLYELNHTGSMVVDTPEKNILLELIKSGLKWGKVTDNALDIAIEPVSSLWDFSGNSQIVPDNSDIMTALERTNESSIVIDGDTVSLNGTGIDLGAIAKGFIADRIKEFLVENGVDSATINLGGNILCIGNRPDGTDFIIGIQKPFGDASETSAAVRCDGKSVVSSGVYERYFYKDDIFYHHILDPKTGYPVDNDLLSVTIISDDSLTGDCLSTGCFVMGREKAVALLDSMDNVYGIFVDKDYNVYYSEGAMKYIK